MGSVESLLLDVQELRRAGRLDMAEAACRRALSLEPENGQIHFQLGCLYAQVGNPGGAVGSLREAARLMPQAVEPPLALGELFMLTGRIGDAIEAFTRAYGIDPNFAPAAIKLAGALSCAGRHSEAGELLVGVVERDPADARARIQLASILNAQQRWAEAEPHARAALDLAPGSAEAAHWLATALAGQDRLDEAEQLFERAIRLDSGLIDSHLNLVQIYDRLSRRADLERAAGSAERAVRRALERRPDDGFLLEALGVVLMKADRFDDAVVVLSRAAKANPASGELRHQLARAFIGKGDFEQAVACGLRAVELLPAPHIRQHLGQAQILAGRRAEGWRNHACDGGPTAIPRYDAPLWDGSPLEGRTLLVRSEHGLGDAIQFARFLPLAAERAGGPVLFECQPELMELFADLPGIARIVPRPRIGSSPAVSFDVQASQLILPALLGVTEKTIAPALLPFRISAQAAAMWRERLSGLKGLKVGLRWAGNPSFADDRLRSLHLDAFAPFAAVGGVSFVSVQDGPPAAEIGTGGHGLEILHVPEGLADLTATAALLQQLDLLISTCTAVPHLAGALGVETWLLLPFVPHWCWSVDHPDDTSWYPRHRLFRQPKHGDWQSVIERVAGELARRAAAPRA
jgi:tetratricopeptide (TPR) repeat protein